jgi:hypothetical protein
MTQPEKPPKRPDLTALPLTDEQLDALATVTDADVLAAQQAWQRHADKAYRNLLLAEEEEPAGDA